MVQRRGSSVADGTAAYILARSSASCSIVRRCSQHFEHGKGRQALDGWTLLEHVTCGIFFFQVFLSLRAGRAPCMDGIGDGGSAAKLATKRLDQDIVTGGASCPCPTLGNMLGTNELDRPNRGVRGGRQTFRSHIPIYMTACSMMIIRHSQAASSQSETQQPLRCVACSSSRPTFPPCAAVLCVVDDRVISVVFLQRTRRTCRVRVHPYVPSDAPHLGFSVAYGAHLPVFAPTSARPSSSMGRHRQRGRTWESAGARQLA